jgi:transcriptional regulator with XRE-family HTH domain
VLTIFGAAVRKLRIEQGLLLKQMADALGVGSAQLSSIEVGRVPLTGTVGEKVMEFFRVRVSEHALSELKQVIDEVLAMPGGGVGSGGRITLPFDRCEPADLVADFARALRV